MRLQRMFAGLLLLSLLFAGACSTRPLPPPPEQQTRIVYPAMPTLECKAAPDAPAADADDNAWAAWKAQDHDAGQDCREKLAGVKSVVAKWPRTGGTDIVKP